MGKDRNPQPTINRQYIFKRNIRYMIIYKFYLRGSINGDIFLGALPERRKNPKRTNDEFIINRGRKYFGKNGKDEDIFFIKTILEENEKRYPNLPLP
jgi:hypothetical protein